MMKVLLAVETPDNKIFEISEVVYDISWTTTLLEQPGKLKFSIPSNVELVLDLFYSSTGILVKTVVDTGHEEDYDDYLPQPDANGIIAIVKQKYPNATIVEIEREKGLQEVTILDENREKEVYFNERNEWMGTSWDVQVANLPEAVKKSVMEKYSDYVIDDADYVVTPDNEWYILDLENKQIDKELKVKIDKDGVWL